MWPEDFANFPEHAAYVTVFYFGCWFVGWATKLLLNIPNLFVGSAYEPHDD